MDNENTQAAILPEESKDAIVAEEGVAEESKDVEKEESREIKDNIFPGKAPYEISGNDIIFTVPDDLLNCLVAGDCNRLVMNTHNGQHMCVANFFSGPFGLSSLKFIERDETFYALTVEENDQGKLVCEIMGRNSTTVTCVETSRDEKEGEEEEKEEEEESPDAKKAKMDSE